MEQSHTNAAYRSRLGTQDYSIACSNRVPGQAYYQSPSPCAGGGRLWHCRRPCRAAPTRYRATTAHIRGHAVASECAQSVPFTSVAVAVVAAAPRVPWPGVPGRNAVHRQRCAFSGGQHTVVACHSQGQAAARSSRVRVVPHPCCGVVEGIAAAIPL